MGKRTWAEKFATAYQSGDMLVASGILGNFLDDVDFDASDDFVVLKFEDKSMAGYIKALNDRKGQAWVLGAGEAPEEG